MGLGIKDVTGRIQRRKNYLKNQNQPEKAQDAPQEAEPANPGVQAATGTNASTANSEAQKLRYSQESERLCAQLATPNLPPEMKARIEARMKFKGYGNGEDTTRWTQDALQQNAPGFITRVNKRLSDMEAERNAAGVQPTTPAPAEPTSPAPTNQSDAGVMSDDAKFEQAKKNFLSQFPNADPAILDAKRGDPGLLADFIDNYFEHFGD